MGGQIADRGYVKIPQGSRCQRGGCEKSTKRSILHKVEVLAPLAEGQIYQLQVDERMRTRILKNHTATHLLHRALKDVLGEHANQAGSLVAPGHLRFDFTHFGQVTSEELARMEAIVNEKFGKLFLLSQLKQILIQRKTWAQWRYLAKNMAKKSV